jgi:hypothetical protein
MLKCIMGDRVFRPLGFCIVVLCCLLGSVSRAQPAAQLLPVIAGSYLSTPGGRVTIVAAGDYAEALPMAQLVEDALSRSERADEIGLSPPQGIYQYLQDVDIVAQFAGQQLDEVVIVRVLPGPYRLAEVRFYNLSGARLTEFQFGDGVEPRPRGLALPGTPGEPALTGTPAESPQEESLPSQRTHVSYEKGFLNVRDAPMTTWQRGKRGHLYKVTKFVMVASQGNAEEIVPWEIFYELANRPDLLSEYQKRDVTNQGLTVTGGITAILSLPFLVSAVATAGFEDKRTPYALAGVGSGLLLGGLVQLLVGGLRSPHPISRQELQELANEHNRLLRLQFELPPPPVVNP